MFIQSKDIKKREREKERKYRKSIFFNISAIFEQDSRN